MTLSGSSAFVMLRITPMLFPSVEADGLEHASWFGVKAATIDGAIKTPNKLATKIDVLRDVEIRNRSEFLENRGDAVARPRAS